MALNAFSTALLVVGLMAFSMCGFVGASPQTFFQQQPPQQQQFEPVSEVCLGCICEAISSCDRNLKCEGDVCGMFRITWAYWADSGKPVLPGDNPNDGQAYARCTNDPTCARQSVVNYLIRFAQDCNHDGSIDCLDYAAIHKLGGYGCSAPLSWDYKSKYDTCQKAVYELSGSPVSVAPLSSALPPATQDTNIMFPDKPQGDGLDVRQAVNPATN